MAHKAHLLKNVLLLPNRGEFLFRKVKFNVKSLNFEIALKSTELRSKLNKISIFCLYLHFGLKTGCYL